jgi:hypothetical protein
VNLPPECDDDTPPRPYVTRKDQLNMKPEKARGRGKEEEEEGGGG